MQRSRWEHAGVRRQVQGQGIEEPFSEVDQMSDMIRLHETAKPSEYSICRMLS